ncbi:hypothetical protein GCM10025859_35300 [Alicyclobacillus fastidiosus]|nr:hypothetical protein GCM10025859_35300 [Alicyclobacillus fastidiosus]
MGGVVNEAQTYHCIVRVTRRHHLVLYAPSTKAAAIFTIRKTDCFGYLCGSCDMLDCFINEDYWKSSERKHIVFSYELYWLSSRGAFIQV